MLEEFNLSHPSSFGSHSGTDKVPSLAGPQL